MLIKLAALGTLGYAGYKLLQSARQAQTLQPSDLRLAGGPLSDAATIQHPADRPSPQPLTR